MEDEQLVRETIVPTQFFLEEYEQWAQAGLHNDLLVFVREQRAIRQADDNADCNYFTFRSEASNGFYFIGEEDWSNKDHSFLVHHFSKLLLAEGYVLNNARRDLSQKDGKLICNEDFYFKLPLSSRMQSPIPQLWGNVHIEHKIIDDRSNYIKIMANVYSDRGYEKARDFIGLEEILLGL